jgi:Ran GTPase-activating protein (RanGAP) involved in mRNA processing and transport
MLADLPNEPSYKSQRLRVIGKNVNSSAIADICKVIGERPDVKFVEIKRCIMSENDFIYFTRAMSSFFLVELFLIQNRLTDKSILSLAAAVQCCSLKKLDLSGNEMSHNSAVAIFESLRDCGIQHLALRSCKISSNAVQRLGQVLKLGRSNLKHLDLSINSLANAGAITLADAIPHCKLETLLLNGNGIKIKGVSAICKAVMRSETLIALSLENNAITDKNASSLMTMMEKSQLESLNLNFCQFTNTGLKQLASGLYLSKTMVNLELLQNTLITDVVPLIEAVRTHRTVRAVKLSGTSIPESDGKLLIDTIQRLHTNRAMVMTALCSVHAVPRLGTMSRFAKFPSDLLRRLADCL